MRLGSYELLALLGSGGMGEVYRARDTRPELAREVAIKVLNGAADDEASRHRFEQEARATAALTHPNVLSIYDVGFHEGRLYLVEELIEGTTLRDALSDGPLPANRAAGVARAIAQGLAAAHARGIVHRDLKPENVMLTRDGRVKILDFGLAKFQPAALHPDASTQTHATGPGTVLGTVSYMSPEQVRGLALDHRSDIFSFGVVLYELLCGSRPFGGDTAPDTQAAILGAEPPDFAPPLAVPPTLGRVVRRCLEKQPDVRFQSAADLAFALETSTASERVAPQHGETRARARRPLAAFVPWGVAVIALVVAAVSVRSRDAKEPAPQRVMRVSLSAGSEAPLAPQSGALGATLSPDGARFAYSGFAADGRSRLLVRSLDSERSTPVAESTNTSGWLNWSPDGRQLLFSGEGKLVALDVTNGKSRILGDAPGFRGGSWSPDGTILYAPFEEGGLFRLPEGGGTPTPVTTIDAKRGESSHRMPWFLPDGRHFLYRVQGGEASGIYLGSLDGPEKVRLAAADSQGAFASGHLLYVVKGTLFAQTLDLKTFRTTGDPIPLATGVAYNSQTGTAGFSVTPNGALIYRRGQQGFAPNGYLVVDRSGNELAQLSLGRGAHAGADISRSGRFAYFSRSDAGGQADIWILDTPKAAPRRVFSTDFQEESPVWSPDEQHVLFFQGGSASGSALMTIPATGGEPRSLLTSSERVYPGDWSPDGRRIAFSRRDAATGWDLYTLDAEGGGEPRILLRTRFNEQHPQFSPDGRWVAYTSDESGSNDVYVRPVDAPNAPATRVSPSGGSLPRWRGDGSELYFLTSARMLVAAQLSFTPGNQVAADTVTPLFPVARQALAVNPAGQSAGYAVSADGTRFWVQSAPETGSPVMDLIINWPALLPAPTP